jgi:hypothetical protein
MAVSCRFVTARLGRVLLPSHDQGHPMLPKLAYLTLCRSMQLLVLLARGDAAKPPDPSSSLPTGCC